MRKRGIFSRIVCAALVLAVACGMLILSSCTAATQSVAITFDDASGKGTLVSTVVVPTDSADNTTKYIKDVQKMAEHLQSKVDRLTSTEGIYTVAYGGKVSGGEAIMMTYSFSDINDYNRKTMRLFYCVPRSVRNRIGGLGDEYKFAAWTQSGDTVTFSQSGDIFTAINLWAYDYLLNNDIEGVWDNTGDGQAAQLSLFGAANDATYVLAGKTVDVTVGGNKTTANAFNGQTAQTVSASGNVSGSFVAVDTAVTDESIIVEHPDETVSDEAVSNADDNESAGKLSLVYPLSTAAIALFMIIAVVVSVLPKKNKEDGNNA